MNFYSVYDKRANIYNTPFPAATDVHATRTFTMQVNHNDASNMLNFAPEDFALFRVGRFNDNTGEIITETPALLCEAEKILKKENN